MALGEICLVSPMALATVRNGFARAELLPKAARLRGEQELAALHLPGDELLVDVPAQDLHHEVGQLDDLIVVDFRHFHDPALDAA